MKVSVITTLYNYSNYIEDNIKSFLLQDFIDSELIIVDDYSTDNPENIINKYSNNRVKYIKLNKNYGYSYAKNIGIKSAKGEYIVMLDADDMLTKNGISLRYNKIVDGYDFVHGPVYDFDGKNYKISKLWRLWQESNKDKECYKFVHAQGVMLKKSLHSFVGLYDEQMRYKSDREMWARIFNWDCKISEVEEPVSIYRIHKNQMHKSKEKLKINSKLEIDFFDRVNRRKKDLSDTIKL
jgi:glycosyltransferase involved in cell wall biosynthesis